VGRRPDDPKVESKLQRLTESGRVEIFYDVEHCGPHYGDALAAIVPLRVGGGTRIKILEAFAHHCPVVSTSKGCEGLPVLNGTELLIADAPDDFAAACVELAQSGSIRERLVKAAHAFLVNNNSQNVVERLLDAALKRAGIISA
jgi:glycosyltransferase involved in cell wall biosynthesis